MDALEIPYVAALVATCLQEEVGTNMLHRDAKLLNCRLDASKREIEAITKKTYLVLHPDREGFTQWLLKKQIMVDQLIYEECKAKVVEVFQVWQITRDRLGVVDQGNYHNAICTHMISWHVLHIAQVS